MIRAIAIFLLVVLAASCTDQGDPAEWLQYERQWQSLNIQDYSIIQELQCFCENAGRAVQLLVRSDTIYSATPLDTLPWPVNKDYYHTVNSLFQEIKSAKAVPGSIVTIRFNAEYGYPELFYFDRIPGAVDEEIGFLTSGLEIQ